jgi:predicted small integral membrane protein
MLPPALAAAQTQGWGQIGQPQDKGFSWTDPLWPGFWMAWTPATLAVFVGIFAALATLTVIEILYPGGGERRGVLGLVTTRGDRLFLTLLGTSYIFMGWLWATDMTLWWPLALSLMWGVFCFWKV